MLVPIDEALKRLEPRRLDLAAMKDSELLALVRQVAPALPTLANMERIARGLPPGNDHGRGNLSFTFSKLVQMVQELRLDHHS